MKALEPHLYSRNGHLYYRSAIPRDLHGLLPIKEVTIALRVNDRLQARILVAQLNQAEQEIIQNLRLSVGGPNDVNIETLICEAIERLELRNKETSSNLHERRKI